MAKALYELYRFRRTESQNKDREGWTRTMALGCKVVLQNKSWIIESDNKGRVEPSASE